MFSSYICVKCRNRFVVHDAYMFYFISNINKYEERVRFSFSGEDQYWLNPVLPINSCHFLIALTCLQFLGLGGTRMTSAAAPLRAPVCGRGSSSSRRSDRIQRLQHPPQLSAHLTPHSSGRGAISQPARVQDGHGNGGRSLTGFPGGDEGWRPCGEARWCRGSFRG